MPAYNEQGAIREAVAEVKQYVLRIVPGSELLVIDDGSRDQTGLILDRIAAEDSRIRVFHQSNGGHGRALRTGLDAARGDYVFLIDSDRQVPLDPFPVLWKAAQGRDGAFGVRVARHDPRTRQILTLLVRKMLKWFLGVRLHDANVPCKIIRRSVWLKAREYIPPQTLTPSLFLAVFVVLGSYDIVMLEVAHRPRKTGEISIRRWKLLKFCLRALLQLFAFSRRLPR